jgi:putative FmdB family regulatory protein
VPTYQYACTECEHGFEVVQAFTDDALTSCPRCQGRLRKVFGSVGVVFKGSGFYRNDSREAKPVSKNGADKTDGTKTEKSDGAKSDGTKADKPSGGKDSGSTSTSSGTSKDSGSSTSPKASSTAGSAA